MNSAFCLSFIRHPHRSTTIVPMSPSVVEEGKILLPFHFCLRAGIAAQYITSRLILLISESLYSRLLFCKSDGSFFEFVFQHIAVPFKKKENAVKWYLLGQEGVSACGDPGLYPSSP